MSKFNSTATRPAKGAGPIVVAGPGVTHEGAPAFVRDIQSELFLLAVSNMVGEDTFYEKASDRDARYAKLVRQAAIEDPIWTVGLLRWLRSDGNMRSASLVGAAEFVKARLEVRVPSVPAHEVPGWSDDRGIERAVIDAVCQRADEPGEMLAYWTSTYGRAIPKPVKRGVADAAMRLYAEYPLLKYDTGSRGVRFADVLELTHPGDRKGSSQGNRWRGAWQGDLFEHAIDRRHNRDNPTPERLEMIRANAELRELAEGDPQAMLDADRLRAAGMTWEDVLSLVGAKLDKAKLWAALIPSMGYMALLRNLRNFDEAGVPDAIADQVAARLADPEQVAKSRQFPFRFLAAYEAAPSLRWGHALDKALTAALSNVPQLDGRTLVLIDTSASMTNGRFSAKSTMTAAKAAAVFGVVLAMRCGADVYGFADGVFKHEVPKGASALKEIDRFLKRTGEVGHGTQILASLQRTWAGHDRVFIISDMQTMDGHYAHGVSNAVPSTVAMYGFNLGGYRATPIEAGKTNRIEFGGLTDATFRMVPLIEAGKRAAWPWM
ncbi:TROVE domain-containing protein [Dactylosporangium roseum]|uniref:TROVE domain-containing protein n=1 Tax=Dactylosporangium roseum TaxID=47989 RepID=UPI0021B2D7CF|nr:TROVE domain-containing protein [Dactylosporangium roseum]